MSYPVQVDRRVFVEMDDGTRIALTTYLPAAAGDGPFPAVVESLPYRKDDDCTARDWETFGYLASKGIAGVRIDIRGTGASTGIIENEYVAREQGDTLEVLAWTAAQDWCTGALGMWGISWGGFSALQTAMLRPPELKAIAPMHATHDRFACDVHYTGGSLHAQEQVDWPTSMVTCNALPPDPDIFGDGWREEWIRRLENTPQWPYEWLRHQRRDGYWLHGSPCADYGAITCPTLLIGGWLDGYVDGMLAMAEHLTCPTRTVIGPWGHHRPATGVPAPTLDHFDLLARWFGHHLAGDDNGVMDMPAVSLYVQTLTDRSSDHVPGRWRSEEQWPPPDLVRREWRPSGTESVTWDGPQWVGSHAPAWDRAGVEVAPSDDDDDASVVFEWDPLEDEVEILGTPEVEVTVSSDRATGMVAARLLAVTPDGDTVLISRGSRNLVFPDDLSDPRPVTPVTPMRVRFPLLACSAVIPSGWSLRLALAGADFPVVWPPGERFRLTIDPMASALILPTIPPRPDTTWLDISESGAHPAPPVEELESVDEREVERRDGTTVLQRRVVHAERQPERADLVYRNRQEWTVAVDDDDPGSTRVWSVSEVSLQRPGWEAATRGSVEMTADAAVFRLRIELAASHDGTEVFRRVWDESVPREWV